MKKTTYMKWQQKYTRDLEGMNPGQLLAEFKAQTIESTRGNEGSERAQWKAEQIRAILQPMLKPQQQKPAVNVKDLYGDAYAKGKSVEAERHNEEIASLKEQLEIAKVLAEGLAQTGAELAGSEDKLKEDIANILSRKDTMTQKIKSIEEKIK